MIQCKCNLVGKLSAKGSLLGNLNNAIVREYPKLEDLVVTPTTEQQTFKSNEYGYDNVTVKGIESEEINIIPSSETQVKEGIYKKVTVAGDNNLVPENIKEGTEIFGVTGIAKTTSARITDASYLFYKGARTDCLNEFLELCDKLTNMSYMFYSCSSLINLDLSNFDTSNVISMLNTFYGCSSLINLDLSSFDTSNTTDMQNIFCNCSSLINLDLSSFNTSKITTMYRMFYSCSSLINLDLSSFDMSKVINISNTFYNCSALTNIKFCNNYGKGFTQKTANYVNYAINLSYSKLLTHESLMDVINKLYDLNLTYNVAGGGTLYTQTLNLGSTNMAKLTAEEIAIATSKRLDSFIERRK